jgi:hypothetical protein
VVVVGFVAAVFALQAVVAQRAQLAFPLLPASELERAVPQAAQPVEQDARLVPGAALVVHSAASPADLRDGPQDDCLAVRLAVDHWQPAAANSVAHC